MVQLKKKIKLTNIFHSVDLQYENNTCDMHTKTAVLNALLLSHSTASHHSRCPVKTTLQAKGLSGGFPDPKESLSMCFPTQAITLANKAVEKAVVNKGLGKKYGQYLISMVALDAATFLILF